KYYDFELLDLTFFMNDLVYIVKFTPRKSSSKFSGTHYISSTDYGILRTDYQFAEGKRGQKFNLKLILGIKYIENLRNGKVIFSKNAEGTY
ncbi:MAG: carboxypeptidase-like regulatory domain-containing protein, partial [Flavobacteriaceae bacterium]|nr:carboxypeptidase-like regulatory domain-containing protein [Flavobacteriaceae bacterium]